MALSPLAPCLVVRRLGRMDYRSVFEAMKTFTTARLASTTDELWAVEHPSVFTQGLNGKAEHLLAPGTIPVIPVDRGGQITYHGPGQVVVYLLVDVRRAQLGVRDMVTLLEQVVIELLSTYEIKAYSRREAPGVYVEEAKIAALGLRIRRGCSYHGLSLNVDMDLEPFSRINPCGYPGLRITQLRDLGVSATLQDIREQLLQILVRRLGFPKLAERDTLPHLPYLETTDV
jgi:lipoyl(octanoyl) transferase